MLTPDRLRTAPARWRALAALVAGGLSALAMPPFGLWPVLALTLPVLVFLIDATAGLPLRRALSVSFLAGWLFGLGYFVAGLWWIGEAFLVQADTFLWLMPFAVLGLPAYLALYTGFGCVLARLLWTDGPGRILAFAVALTLAETARGAWLTGFPWNDFGYALATDLRFAQAASIVGVTGLCLAALACLASPAALFSPGGSPRTRPLPLALAVLLLAALWAGGQWRLATTEVATVPDVRLRLMQPDLPQDQKFRYDARRTVMDLYLATSESQGGLKGVTHLFWPESAFPFFLEREPEALARIVAMLPPGTVLVTGAARYQPVPGRDRPDVFNSVRVIDSNGTIRGNADKVHLVPFGEYLPFQETLEAVGLEALTRVRGGFAAAPARRLLAIPGLPQAVPLICYEAIFPGEVMPAPAEDAAEAGPRPGFLLNLSNDAWFGLTPGPYQHFEQSRLRAIEQGLPLVRVTNNGISAVVDPLGRTSAILPLGVRGVLDDSLPQALAATAYATHGRVISWLLLLGCFCGALMLRLRAIHA